MKHLKLIIAITILLLAIKPGIDMLSLQGNTEQACCSQACSTITDQANSPDQQDPKDNCGGKSCNPFQVCSMCVSYFQVVSSLTLPLPKFISIQYSYQSARTSQYISDFWQPPKIV